MVPSDEASHSTGADDGSGGDADRADDSDDRSDPIAGASTDATGPTEGPGGRREVVVPMELYKVVTVFSTLIAVGLVVLGFVLLDTGTTMLGRGPAGGPAWIGGLVSLSGVAVILGGAAVYVYAARFRTGGMGKPKDDAGERDE